MMSATVMTVRTTIEPGKRTLIHTIVIAGSRARNTAEHEVWRIFDTNAKTVTVVDDLERAVRTETLASILKRRHAAMAGELPSHFPDMGFERSNETRTILGRTARKAVITSGTYRRELWVAEHPAVPAELFSMMQAVETPSSPLAPMMRKADAALETLRGFPLIDHSEVAYGNRKFVVDRVVVSISTQSVPKATLEVPAGYRVVNPAVR